LIFPLSLSLTPLFLLNASVGNRFNLYVSGVFQDKAPPRPKAGLSGWKPSFTLDPYFLSSPQCPVSQVSATVMGDRIILPRGVGGGKTAQNEGTEQPTGGF
jgi:hypothetical protein